MMPNEELSEKVKGLSEEAVAMAAAVFEIRLSYQKEDMDLLEERIFPVLEKMIAEGKINENGTVQMAVFFGAYLGELILRSFAAELGYAWLDEEDGPPRIVCGANKFNPLAKVRKRLTQGSGDDIRPFYDVCLKVAQGGFQ